MSKKILFMSSAKLTAICFGLLLAVFCTIGMSFRPVYGEEEKEIVMSGPRRSHWHWVESGCVSDTHHYKSSKDYAQTQVQTMGNGIATISTEETTNVTSPASGSPRVASTTAEAGNTASISWNSGLEHNDQETKGYDDGAIAAAHKKTFTLTATPANPDEYYFAGWGTSTSESSINKNDNPRVIVSDMEISGYTDTSADNQPANYATNTYTEKYYAFFKARVPVYITLMPDPNGSISYSYKNVPTTTISGETTFNTKYDVTLIATPNEGYVFFGWYTLSGSTENYISYANPNNRAYKEDITIYAKFIPANQATFNIKGTEQYYYDLGRACSEAASSTSKIVYPLKDGFVPAGNYTIPSGVTLVIPYNSAVNSQTIPELVKSEYPLYAYRKLTLVDGVNITVNGDICVGGQQTCMTGGKPSGYATGACGVLDMSSGGHIELNSGSNLYAWGFVKGQDMDQGNNTVGVGTITANNGANVWEDFAVGDWRGGSACLDIEGSNFFPFQSYFIQNIEVPLTVNYGAVDNCYASVSGGGEYLQLPATMIGTTDALFKLSSGSVVRKWYDATTDLMCFELSGTANLDAVVVKGLPVIGNISSKDYYLPISSNMHIMLTKSSVEISKPMVLQPGAKVEIKSDATITISSNVFLYDQTEWGPYAGPSYYFHNYGNTYGILTTHKNRGNGKSKDLLDDAQFIVDGQLNITGKLYTTASGADIMGNDGGRVQFSAIPTSSSSIDAFTGNGDAVSGGVTVNTANLHNEDDSYTKSIGSTTFHNVDGRWFTAAAKDSKDDHTYDFTYIKSGVVSGTGGTDTLTNACYSNDKTGLEARMKWVNIDPDACPNWWIGHKDTYFYNWTENSDWHQFMPTATEGMYSGSNNKIYTKTDCVWGELGETDVNCLYTIGGVKKALVEGEFIALEPNNNDPAYHAADDETKYYICFSGCNWHEADKYEEVQKAYIISPDTFIWYNNAWMSVNFKQPFAYTLDETNVPVYYEYLNGEWVLAEPYVRVVDGIEDRSYYFIEDAFKFANSVLRTEPKITILHDISGITTALSYTGANKTCTLDLNGHIVSGAVPYVDKNNIGGLLVINASGSTFTITDKSGDKNGRIENSFAQNTRTYGVNLTNGTLVLEDGIIFAENTLAYNSTSAKSTAVSAVYVAAGQTFTMNAGSAHAKGCYSARGVDVAGSTSANATVNINAGTVTAETTQASTAYGIYAVGGTTKVKSGATINAIATTTTAYGICIEASTKKYFGSLEMAGGTVNVESRYTSTSKDAVAAAVYVGGTYIMANTTPNTISVPYRAVANISGGTFNVVTTTARAAYGVRTRGTTTITGGTFNVMPKTTMAYGIWAEDGIVEVSSSATFTVKATATAYGIYANGVTPDDKTGRPYNPVVTVKGGTFNVQTTSKTTAYGVFVNGNTRPVTSTASGNYQGNYASAGNVTVNGGIFNVTAKTTAAYGAYVAAPKEEAGATSYDPVTANPKCTINGGYFKLTGTSDVNAVNNLATTDNLKVQGGYYSHNGYLEDYKVSPKQVLTLAPSDPNRPDYEYKVADAYLITFKTEDGTGENLQLSYQEAGAAPVYSEAEPTKSNSETQSFVFDGWATEANGAKTYNPNELPNVSADATYYAHFNPTTLKYRVHLDATTNGGLCETENIYVAPGTAVGTLPNATKVGHTFNGWFSTSAATGGTPLVASTVINADAEYFARFTVNSNTLTWHLDGGKVTTAGTAAAKNATGSPSGSVNYGAPITVPVVAKTGYTFIGWSPNPAITMPDEDVTYTAFWNPKTSTAYTVKHYLQNVDGTYPAEPTETEALTGTTAASVTPAVKSYDGFVSPATQTKTIAADGTSVVEYQYARQSYTIDLDATTNGGTCATASVTALHEATIASLPEAVKEEGKYAFLGWFTKAEGGTQITDASIIGYNMQKLYAQFSPTITTFTITWLNENNSVLREDVVEFDAIPSYGSTPTKEADAQYTYTFNGWTPAVVAARADASYTATFNSTLNKYAITFKNGDDVLQSSEIDYGTTPSYAGTPTKPTTESYTYTFDGWSTAIDGDVVDSLPAVSAAVTYYAHFAATANVACVKVGSADPTYYTDFAEAWEATNSATGEVTLKLLQDVSGIATSLAYTNAQNCTLDLNNHTLSGAVDKLLNINTTAKFTIDDSSEDKNGMVSMIHTANARLYCLYITKGNVTLKNGKIYSKNTHTYSSATANKSSAATAVYVTQSQTFIMDGGAVESEAQHASYAILADKAGTTTITINDGLVKGHTNKSTTAAGIYTYAKGLTVNDGRIVGHAYTTTAYGILLYGGSATLNGGTIEATNDTTNSAGTTTTYGVYVRYSSSSYKGVLTVPATSTVNVLAKSRTTTACAVYVYASSTASTIAGGTFTAKAGTTTAQGINSAGTITVSGGTFNVSAATTSSTITTAPVGIYSTRGTVTVTGNPTFNVTSGAARAFGVFAYGTIGAKGTGKYSGTININGGTFNVTSTTTTAYGAYAGLLSKAVSVKDPENPVDTIAGQHYMPGIISITDGTFNVKAKTTKAYGLVLTKEQNESGAVGTTLRSPKITVTGGKFKVESAGDANATAYAISSSNNASQATMQGGWYSVNANLSRYVEPEKSCNYHVLDLTGEDPYKYEVAEAYTVTFNANGHGTAPESQLIVKDQKATAPAEPTATGYTFGGWYKEAGCTNKWDFALDVVTAATPLYAKWTENTHKLAWNFDGGTPSGNYTEANNALAYGSAITYPTLSKTGYTFAGWSSDATSMPDADLTITASWIVNTHKLAWNFDGGTPSGSYTEAGNAIAYGTAITYPILSKTGYTFAGWSSSATAMPDGDLTITANWTINQYTVSFNSNGGSAVESITQDYNTAVMAPVDPTREGYTFNGWSPAVPSVMPLNGLTCEAQWTPKQYTITFDSKGGSAVESITQGYTSAVTAPADPTKTGYTFAGWSPEVPETMPLNGLICEAQWTPSTYDIIYKDQNDIEFSGVLGSGYPTTHTYGTATALVNPTKAGYTFDGWYDNADCTGSALTEIDATAYTADFILYAKWTIKSNCTIRWVNYDGTLLCESTIQREGTPNYPNHGPVPTKPGDANRTYTFIGWSPEIHAAYDDETYTAQYSMSITTGEPGTYTVSGTEDAVATTVQVSGALHIPEGNSLTTGDLIVEAYSNGSGTIDGIERVTVTSNAYFDYEFNVDPWHWSAFGVPFEIDLDAAAPLKEKTSPLGIVGPDDYDIVYYDTEERAANGASKNCWKYVDNETHRLIPGRLYMIAFDKHVGRVGVLRFKKAASAPVNCTTPVQLITTGPAGGNNNWNGIANPMMYHALLGAGVTECQVHDGGEIGKDGYYTYNMTDKKFFVGKAAFVQVPQYQDPVVVTPADGEDPLHAPRRTKATVATDNRYDIQIAPSNETAEDRLLVLADEDKADEYVIVSDLAKAGVSPVRAQMWVDRYSEKLCKNTTAFINNKADYPLVISTPKAGEYDLFINEQPDDETMLYLTYDGNAIWNLSYGGYVAHLEKGTTSHYGLRIVRTPKVSTGIEETTIQNGEAIRKVIVDDKVYIIRNGEIYSITGQKAQ